MNELNLVFAFNHNTEEPCVIRVVGTAETPLFPATDICRALGIANARQAMQGLEEDDVCITDTIDSMGRKQKANCVTKHGLYALVFLSRKPRALAFRRWVIKDVLESIEKTGAYIHRSIDRGELFKLFYACKSAAGQMAILQALGINPAPLSLSAKPAKRARIRYEPKDFWPAVLALVEAGALPVAGVFRAERCSTNPVEAYHLMLLPGPMVQALAAGLGPFHGCRRDDLQASAKGWPGFVPGKHVQRFGAGAEAAKCWMFRSAEKEGPLMGLIRLALDQTE